MAFFVWIQSAGSAAPLVGKLEYSGLVGVLLLAVGALWMRLLQKDKDLKEKEAALRDVLTEMLTHTEIVNQIPASLDRLRTEVLAKVERCPLLGERGSLRVT